MAASNDDGLDFTKLRQQARRMKQAAHDRQLSLNQMANKQKRVQDQLQYVQKQRGRLDEKESQLQAQAGDLDRQEEDLKAKTQQDQEDWQALQVQLKKAKNLRNQKLVAWWMQTYPGFDQMSLEELEKWLTTAIDREKNGHSSVGNGSTNTGGDSGHRSNKVQRTGVRSTRLSSQVGSLASRRQVKTDGDDNVRSSYLKVQQTIDDQAVEKAKARSQSQSGKQPVDKPVVKEMSYQDRQRVFTNEDENNPIDTMGEAQDAEQLKSPYGSREAGEDADNYLAKQEKRRRKAKADATAKYQKAMNDGPDLDF